MRYMTKPQIEKKILELEGELRELRRSLNAPTWCDYRGESTFIVNMSNSDLIVALRCCIRKDERYDWTSDRMRQFAQLIREAARRRIPAEKWIDG